MDILAGSAKCTIYQRCLRPHSTVAGWLVTITSPDQKIFVKQKQGLGKTEIYIEREKERKSIPVLIIFCPSNSPHYFRLEFITVKLNVHFSWLSCS